MSEAPLFIAQVAGALIVICLVGAFVLAVVAVILVNSGRT